jgi:hypothetical protein
MGAALHRPKQRAARRQEHFYLEPNCSLVVPGEADEVTIISSTQARRAAPRPPRHACRAPPAARLRGCAPLVWYGLDTW